MITRKYTFFVIFLSITLTACFGGGGGGGNNGPVSIDLWTWVSGSNVVEESGVYNDLDPANNFPGARQGSVTWTDSSGNLWLFGGKGYDSASVVAGWLNDLWRWDGTNWTRVSGSETINQSGTYNDANPANDVPGAREDAISWIDSNGDLWLFGGNGYDSAGAFGLLNDLWRWDGANWNWESGSDTINQNGVYSDAVPANNFPGSRRFAVSWIDASDNLWLFGGLGRASTGGTNGRLNDLWQYDPVNDLWTWMSGSNARNPDGIYNDLDPANNVPGGRQAAVSWIDTSGNLWLFGGFGNDSVGTIGPLNDLWRWDGANWSWLSGSDTVNQPGIYGTANDLPGARYASTTSTDASGNAWLFGGQGYDVGGNNGRLNDLWRWNGSSWSWISGSDTINQTGNYGVQGTAEAANVPGARNYGVSWVGSNGNFWLFGGIGIDSTGGTASQLNDLWRYQP